jgi:ABC-type phosphate transport system substrate-binding protein
MRKLLCTGLLVGTLGLSLARGLAQPRSATGSYVVIVNAANPVASIDRKFLEEAFLKKTTRWPNDEVIRPVDLSPSTAVRRQFTDEVLKRPVEAIKGYWQQRIFSGRDVPPPELNTDADVIKYVAQYEGAVGYVSSGADLAGTKVLVIE